MTYGFGLVVLAAGNVLLALLLDELVESTADDVKDRDVETEVVALTEETETIATGATANGILQD